MKFSWSLFWVISGALILAKLVIVPIAGFFVFEQAMGAGWGGASVDSAASKLPVFVLLLFCPALFGSIILFKGTPELLIPAAIVGELITTFILSAAITRIFFVFAHIPKTTKESDRPEIQSET